MGANRHILLLFAASLALLGCLESAPSKKTTRNSGKEKRQRRKAAAKKRSSLAKRTHKPADMSRWPAAVKDLYQRVRKLPAGRRGEILTLMRTLGQYGAKAEGALSAMTWDSSLAAEQRAMAGVLYAGLHAYDPAMLERLVLSDNIYGAKEAATLLARLGGLEAKAALEKAVQKGPPQLRQLAAIKLGELEKKPLPKRARQAFHVLLTDPDEKKQQWAATVLTVDYPKQSQRRLLALIRHSSSSKGVQMQAAVALGKIAEKDVAQLTRYCQVGQHPYLRYIAARELVQKHGAKGREAVEQLAKKRDPMTARFRSLLQAK
jgi:hypothetical protein